MQPRPRGPILKHSSELPKPCEAIGANKFLAETASDSSCPNSPKS